MSTGPEHDGSLVSATVTAGLGMSAGSRAARFRHGRLRGSGLWGFNSDPRSFRVVSRTCGRQAGTFRDPAGTWCLACRTRERRAPVQPRGPGAQLLSRSPAIVVSAGQMACIGRTSGRCRRCSLAGMPDRAPRLVLPWAGDGPPIRWCTTRMRVQVPLGHVKSL